MEGEARQRGFVFLGAVGVGLFDRFRRQPAESKYDTLDLWKEVYGGTPTWSGSTVSLEDAMRVAVAFACGRVISEDIAKLPWKLLRQDGGAIHPATEHPLYDLLSTAPNPLQTSFEFVETMGLHLCFSGNSFAYTPRVSGRIDEMWLLEPGWMTVHYEFQKQPRYEVKSPDGKVQMTLTGDEIWHVRGPSWSSVKGLQFMDLARQALGLTVALEKGQARLQKEGARVPGVLSVEGKLTDEQHKKLTAWIEKYHVGSDNAGRPMILDNAAKWAATAMTNVDAELSKMRAFQIEEVCRFMRVLPIMVQHSDGQAGYASVEQRFIAHGSHTIQPWITRIEKSADKNLLTRQERSEGYYTKFNEKALLRTTAKDQMEILARGVLTGILTRNGAREKLDENPLDGLDEPLTPANTFVGDPPQPPNSGDQV